jgi:uncharacterized membrane protein
MSEQAISQSEIMRKNITAVVEMQRKMTEAKTTGGFVADYVTRFAGSMIFVYLHVIWFGVWILLNTGLINIPHVSEFDPFPFPLLTTIVSLEAIFLSTFVLISQNRLAAASEKRAELDLQVNLLAEQKAAKVLDLLDQMTAQLDNMSDRFNFKPDPEVKALKVSPEPEEVLEVIEETAQKDSMEIKKVSQEVKEITDEVEAVHSEVKHTSGKLDEVAEDVEEIKQEVKEITGERKPVSFN